MRNVAVVGLILLALVSLETSCGNSPSRKSEKVESVVPDANVESLAELSDYRPPIIPAMLTAEAERLEFYVSHYWDDFNFRDTTLLNNSAYVEQAFSNFIVVLPQLPYNEVAESLKTLMGRASVDSTAFDAFMNVTEKYLYNPNSPMRNDEYFLPVLEYVVASDKLEDLLKIRPKAQLEMVKKNRIGTLANDFIYTQESGESHSMHSIDADYTLLFFNNPDCEDCKRVKTIIANEKLFGELTSKEGGSSLSILCVYADEDVAHWRETSYPDIVINSYDKGCVINTQRLYDLKASPTLYLLGADKSIILKDASIETVISYLSYRYNGKNS